MSNIYCGVGEPKGKQRLGTKEECIKKNQIRLYGLNKITKDDIDNVKNGKKLTSSKPTLSQTKTTNKSPTKLTTTKTTKKKIEINKENDKKYSIMEIKKIKYGIDIHKRELYTLDKKRKDSKTGKLNKTDEKKYKNIEKWINDAENFIKIAVDYQKRKKSSN